jgi:glutathione S-transferase
MYQFIAMGVSPWSEKARWALDHSGVSYKEIEHTAMAGEPLLRWRARKFTGRVSVPILVGEGARLLDSFDIARFADEHRTRGESLFPKDLCAQIEEWNARSERATFASRAVFTRRCLEDKNALAELLPPFVPGPLRPAMTFLTAQGSRYLLNKYGANSQSTAEHESVLREEYARLRKALAGGEYLHGKLTYADIAMATALQFLMPPPEGTVALGPAARGCATHAEISREFADLGKWRDALYARHR